MRFMFHIDRSFLLLSTGRHRNLADLFHAACKIQLFFIFRELGEFAILRKSWSWLVSYRIKYIWYCWQRCKRRLCQYLRPCAAGNGRMYAVNLKGFYWESCFRKRNYIYISRSFPSSTLSTRFTSSPRLEAAPSINFWVNSLAYFSLFTGELLSFLRSSSC